MDTTEIVLFVLIYMSMMLVMFMLLVMITITAVAYPVLSAVSAVVITKMCFLHACVYSM